MTVHISFPCRGIVTPAWKHLLHPVTPFPWPAPRYLPASQPAFSWPISVASNHIVSKFCCRFLLIESQLPPKFWAEAMNTYSYIKNRTPHERNNKSTPEELFTRKKPTIKHLKVFGCRAEYWIPKFKRYKFEKITKSGIFVGYSNKRKAFRICDPKNYAITETRDVSFIEKEKGAELLSNEVKAEMPDHVLIDSNFCQKMAKKKKNQFLFTKEMFQNPQRGAINSPDKEKWVQAMKGEIDSLNNHKVWDVLPMTKTIKPINQNGHDPLNPIHKARLVAVGCSQKLGVDYSETYSPVIKSDSLRTLIVLQK
ncbi:hypothetical protein LAZ67_2005758 [Cordylochernes scorpioides]|uniref:Retroviral polymerase SH3-like domain-containing protein n=1 Tax=Cordylochernes scorpioides TaxID=51811 RepID=A0ABY6K997_9ARAC|nr:hypothetical protein LAZ67_2005758 [Cordylochernes scorpioides]